MSETHPPRIATTTVGSYPVPDWLSALPTEQGAIDATRLVFDTQRAAGIDLPTDGELSRFDANHPETNGMIEHFVSPLRGTRTQLGRSEIEAFQRQQVTRFRAKPAAVVEGPIGEGALDLLSPCQRSSALAPTPGHFKFTLTSPYMLARTLLDRHYGDFDALLDAIAAVLAEQVKDLPCAAIQIDEANVPGNPDDAPRAARAINTILDAVSPGTQRAVHFCFGNYGGQTVQRGTWAKLTDFLSSLHCDYLVLELAHRPKEDLAALKDVAPGIGLGIGVVDIKVNHVETADEIAGRIEQAEQALGEGRVQWVHPDCGFWMLKRPIADRKIAALVEGRDRYLGLA